MSKEKLIPDLRFPEFKNEGKWTFEELEQCLDYLQPTPYLVESTDYKDEYEIPVLTAGKTFILGYTNEKEGVFRENLPVIIFDDFTTASQFVDFPFKAKSSAMKILLAKNDNNIKFVYEAIKNINYEVGVHQRHWISIFSKLKIAIPKNPQEQQKIASCLSSLDEMISAHSQKLDLLKDHKKGLMQNLFPQEGEKVPKNRFKEFEKDGEWVEEILGDVIKYFKGFAFQSNDYTSKGRRIIRVSDMAFDSIKNENNAIYINEDNAIQFEKWKLKKYDLIITTVGSKPPMYDSLVGRSIIVESKDENALLNQNAVCLRANSKIAQGFLNTLFKRNEYVTFIESIIRGNANQGSIALEDLFKYKFLNPQNPKEQKKIASCLSSLDALITTQAEKIEQLKLHKKGLMQGLFPKIND